MKTRNENGESRLLSWQFASCLLIIFANISMTWGVKISDAGFWLVALSYSRIRHQNKLDTPGHWNIKEKIWRAQVVSLATCQCFCFG
jgi:hypothetical protein